MTHQPVNDTHLSWRPRFMAVRSALAYCVATLALLCQILLPALHIGPPQSTDIPREVATLSAALGQDVPLCLHVDADQSDHEGQTPGPLPHHHDDCPLCHSLSHLAGVLPTQALVLAPSSVDVVRATYPPYAELVAVPVHMSARARAPPILA